MSFSNQTLNTISAEKNSTIVFPLPIDLLTFFMKKPAIEQQKEALGELALTTFVEVIKLAETMNQEMGTKPNIR